MIFFKSTKDNHHDAPEFITRWIDCLTKEMRETQQEVQLNNLFGFTMNSIFKTKKNKTFSIQGENNSTKTDDDSEFSIYKNTEFYLSLNVTIGFNSKEEKEKEHNLVDCIKEIEQEEKISNENEPDKFKLNEFNQLLPILQINLNRSEAVSSMENGYQKLSTPVNFPEELDIHSTKYDLYAFIAHIGSAQLGHCFCHIRNFTSNQWYFYDESKVVLDDDI